MTASRDLEARTRALLAAASVIAEAPTQNLDRAATHATKPGTREPSGTGPSLFDMIVGSLVDAGDDYEAWRRAVYHGEVAVERARRAPVKRRELAHERDRRIIADFEGMPPAEAAAWESVTPENIRRVRLAHDRNPSTGCARQADTIRWATVTERAQIATRLHDDGQSFRRIAGRLGVSVGTIQRDLDADRHDAA